MTFWKVSKLRVIRDILKIKSRFGISGRRGENFQTFRAVWWGIICLVILIILTGPPPPTMENFMKIIESSFNVLLRLELV